MEADEKIFNLRRESTEPEQVAEKPKQSIYDEAVVLDNTTMIFSEQLLLDGKISLRLPQDFVPLSAYEVKSLFPNGAPEQIVLSNEAAVFMVTVHHTSNTIYESELKEFVDVARMMIERVGPKASILNSEILRCGDNDVVALTLVSQTISEALYNLMMYASVDDKLLIIAIQCVYEDLEDLEDLAKEMALSYRVINEQEVGV